MNATLEKMIDVLPIIKNLFANDIFLSVIDENCVMQGYSIPDGAVPVVNIGEEFVDNTGGLQEVFETGKRKYNFIRDEKLGGAFEGYLIPIFDGGKVVGCLTSTMAVEDKARMQEIVVEFDEATKQVDANIQDIVGKFDELYHLIDGVNQMTDKVEGDISASEEIVSSISSNASKSNILALNASIEAARSGENGRGFSVVAKEMGVLAKASSTSTAEIQKQLQQVRESMNKMIESINGTDAVASEYNSQIKTIQETVANMLVLSKEMQDTFAK